MKRRRVLATLAASGVAATAGCSSVLSESGGGPYDAGGHVQWLGASDGAVFALSEGDPNTLHGVDGSWTADVAGVATPLVDDGVVAVPTGADDRGIVYCPEKIALFDAESGTRQWRVSAPHCPELVTVGPDAVFTAETSDAISESGRRLAALDRADGATRWERDVGTVNDAVRTDDALLVAHRGGLDKLDPASGDVLWSIPELTRPRSLSVSGDEVVAVGDTVSRIDGGTGEVTTSFSPSGSQVADAAVVNTDRRLGIGVGQQPGPAGVIEVHVGREDPREVVGPDPDLGEGLEQGFDVRAGSRVDHRGLGCVVDVHGTVPGRVEHTGVVVVEVFDAANRLELAGGEVVAVGVCAAVSDAGTSAFDPVVVIAARLVACHCDRWGRSRG